MAPRARRASVGGNNLNAVGGGAIKHKTQQRKTDEETQGVHAKGGRWDRAMEKKTGLKKNNNKKTTVDVEEKTSVKA